MSLLQSFKFLPDLKSPFVLRPIGAPLPMRLLLAGMKVLGSVPRRVLGGSLRVDANERIVEYPFVLRRLRRLEGAKIVVVGCTRSVLSIQLATMGAEVLGVDLRPYPFSHPGFEFRRTDFQYADVPDRSMDAAVAVSTIEHCGLSAYGSDARERGDRRMVEKISRVLRPGGQFLMTVPVGNPTVLERQRIYDCAMVERLVRGLRIERLEYYRKAEDGTHWSRSSADECSELSYDSITGVQAVALVDAIRETTR